ncbi:hypothetical protein PSEWESI4_03870 [Pseudomonas carbonaria]|uniref:Uncharacterized protein n=2 Tax=Zestomonas carbonaria TaxID=2762745 RepID=A0A7U7ESS9_9GAMM|nr:hypothetical protein PSEWESI4_03870 [Pseudomonas carbonaria]
MVNGREVCRDPNDNECIKVDGSNKCIMDEMQCNYVNLVLQCTVGDKPQRNCAYHNGKQVCTDPNDPNKLIDENSPDHPKNGGNADGDETNDPKEPGSEGGTAQDGDAAATNEAIKDLQDGLGGKIDKTNSLLEQIKKGLLGDDYSSDAEWTDEGAKASGEGAGGQIASALDTAVDEALEGSEAELKDALDALPGTVEGWFGVGGERLAGVGVLDNLFPSAVGCSDYRVNVGIPRYSFTLVVPTCELSRVKPLLEWLLWCLTAVGVWNIYMSGLRLENAKAIRGGF